MPCDTVQVTRVNMSRIPADQVRRSLEEAGIAGTSYWQSVPQECGKGVFRIVAAGNGSTIETQGQVDVVKLTTFVKTAHTRRVVMTQAQRFGWKVQVTGQNTFRVTR